MIKQRFGKVTNALKEELTCALCQEVYVRPHSLISCLHTFCLDCVNAITNEGNGFPCPICRKSCENFVRNFAMQNFIDIYNKAELDLNLDASRISEAVSDETANEEGNNDEESANSVAVRRVESLSIRDRLPVTPDILFTTASSSPAVLTIGDLHSSSAKHPCRSCQVNNNTHFTCTIPITEDQQSGFGHILCGYCSEYLPARGLGGNEPGLNQCCSFCGVVACDEYWGCQNTSISAKLFKLSELEDIYTKLRDTESIEIKKEGHLNLHEISCLQKYVGRTSTWRETWCHCLNDFDENIYTTPIIKRMTPLAQQIYNTRRLPNYDSVGSNSRDEDEDENYYDRIGEFGVKPSEHLRACYKCAVTVINGQFYGFWKSVIGDGLESEFRECCPNGTVCDRQWTDRSHAEGLSHVELGTR